MPAPDSRNMVRPTLASTLNISSHHRILLFAPHPDDEVLCAGGLLQRAVAVGAHVEVVLATDGDNNPWPNRIVERKWKIEAEDRAKWGARRRQESVAALAHVGVRVECAHFLALPDQGVTNLFLHGGNEVVDRIAAIIERARPNLFITPSSFDLHPDHSALNLLVRLALAQVGLTAAARFNYLVHSRGRHAKQNRVELRLTEEEREGKREAILCHRTQMALSRKRFVAFAKDFEEFWLPAEPREIDVHHPVRGARIENGALRLQLHRRKRSRNFAGHTLCVAIESEREGSIRWTLSLPARSRRVEIRNTANGEPVRLATARIHGVHAEINLPIALLAPISRVFVKLQQPTMFYDRAGWREVPHTPVAQREVAERLPVEVPVMAE